MKNLFVSLMSFLLLVTFSITASAQQKKAVLNHIALYVTDLKKSNAFYSDIIQLDTIPEPFHDGMHTWYGVGPKSHLHLIAGANQKKDHDKNVHLCFSVNSVDEFVGKLQKAGIVYEDWSGNKGKIQNRVDGVKQIWFRDPDGYWIEINDAK